MRLLSSSCHLLSALFGTVLLLSLLITPGSAYISYCKCQCADKYEIIALDPPHDLTDPDNANDSLPQLTCYNCTRSYCLNLDLDICRQNASTNGNGANGNEAGEVEIKLTLDDYTATCFNRESMKEKLIVYLFCLATLVLVAYASLKSVMGPVMDRFNINRNTL